MKYVYYIYVCAVLFNRNLILKLFIHIKCIFNYKHGRMMEHSNGIICVWHVEIQQQIKRKYIK